MFARKHVPTVMILAGLALAVAGLALAQPLSGQPAAGNRPTSDQLLTQVTSFTYQGYLADAAGQPISGECDMAFRLYDAETGGAPVGSAITASVPISHGYLAASLDFGASAFDGSPRWLETAIKCAPDAAYTTLPRQALGAVPYAVYAQGAPWSGLTGMPAGFADGIDNVAAVVSGTAVYAGEGLSQVAAGDAITLSLASTYRLPQACAGDQVARWGGAAWTCSDDEDTDTTYTAGAGLALAGTEFSIPSSYRLPQACADGQIAEWDSSAWACGDDDTGTGESAGDITAVYAGPGLAGGGETGVVTLTVVFSGTGMAEMAARSDHDHDGDYAPLAHTHAGGDVIGPVGQALSSTWAVTATWASTAGDADTLDGLHAAAFAGAAHAHDDRYYTEGEVDTLLSGKANVAHTHAGSDITSAVPTATLALSATQAPWTGLAGVPAGFADGVDDDTTYTAGAGLALSDTTFSVTTDTIQARVSGACSAGYAIRQVNADGTVACEADDDTTYTAGAGLLLTGTTFTADTTYLQRRAGNVVVVAKSGGDYDSIQAAIDSITDASASNPYLVWVAPGVYSETVTMKSYVAVEGAGKELTTITHPGSSVSSEATVVLSGYDNVLRHLRIESTGGTFAYALISAGVISFDVQHVTLVASSGASESIAAKTGCSGSGQCRYENVEFIASGGTGSVSVTGLVYGGSNGQLFNMIAQAAGGSGSNAAVQISITTPGTVEIRNSILDAQGANAFGLYYNTPDSPGTGTIRVDTSRLTGATNTIKVTNGAPNIYVGGSHLSGGTVSVGSSLLACAGIYDEKYAFYASTCP